MLKVDMEFPAGFDIADKAAWLISEFIRDTYDVSVFREDRERWAKELADILSQGWSERLEEDHPDDIPGLLEQLIDTVVEEITLCVPLPESVALLALQILKLDGFNGMVFSKLGIDP